MVHWQDPLTIAAQFREFFLREVTLEYTTRKLTPVPFLRHAGAFSLLSHVCCGIVM